MALQAGTRLGTYQITALIGSGGMGEVYSALDRRLAREVAIKVLREGPAGEKGLARVEREARLLASLNHPGIAILYGIEEWNGSHFLVMELVEGETLAERIRRKMIPVPESLSLFWQIAQALEAAHRKQIIHRDLKPANIKITPEGKSKILDFGLATAFVSEQGSGPPPESPTITRESRVSGGIGGTLAYMSPEQARGKPLDQRTDIWSFGCCWYETLAGSRAFHGETAADVIAAILRSDPEWDKLPQETPPQVRSLLRRCLEREPSRRLHEMTDVLLAIETVWSPSPAFAFATPRDLSTVTRQPHEERTATVRPSWDLKADLRVDRQGFSDETGASAPSATKAGRPRSCTLTLGIAFTTLAALGTGIYLFRSERALSPAEGPQMVSAPPEVEGSFASESDSLKLAADEALEQIVELKNDDAGADETVWKRAESVEALGRQAYDAEDYETATRRFRTALEVYQSALASASPPDRDSASPPDREAATVAMARPAQDSDQSAIRAALADYEKALETKNLALFRAVYPNLTVEEEQRLQEAFRRTSRHAVELQVDEIAIQGEEATVTVTRTDRVGAYAAPPEPRKQTFRLRKDGSTWVIVEIS
jgi:serine/threonine protein kinase